MRSKEGVKSGGVRIGWTAAALLPVRGTRMSQLDTLRDQVSRLQVEIARLRSEKKELLDQRSTTLQLIQFQERAGPDSRGLEYSRGQLALLDEELAETDAQLAEQQDNLSRAHGAWMGHLSELPEKIVVLFFAANPFDQPRLRLDEEARLIAQRIRQARHRDAVRLESCWAVQPGDLIQAMNEHRPRVVHFSGHGTSRDEIVFQDMHGNAKPVSKAAIVQTLQACSGDIQLVFFNTCFSKEQARAVVKHVRAVVGMNTAIGDDAARVFSAQFYSSIAFGLSVKRAFEQAKAALMLEGIREEDTPELFVADGLDPEGVILVRPPDAPTAGGAPRPEE